MLPLDVAARIDETAGFLCRGRWGDLDLLPPFGRAPWPEEDFVRSLDSSSGASLKLTILNHSGRIWTMVAGGGASVVFADTCVLARVVVAAAAAAANAAANAVYCAAAVACGAAATTDFMCRAHRWRCLYLCSICDLGASDELANYGEYSGAPSELQTYECARRHTRWWCALVLLTCVCRYARTVIGAMVGGAPRADGKASGSGGGA